MTRFLVLAVLAAWAGPAAAEEAPSFTAAAALPMDSIAAHDPLECLCRANGRTFTLGERICLSTAEGPKVAECKMVLNNTSWGITERPCPES